MVAAEGNGARCGTWPPAGTASHDPERRDAPEMVRWNRAAASCRRASAGCRPRDAVRRRGIRHYRLQSGATRESPGGQRTTTRHRRAVGARHRFGILPDLQRLTRRAPADPWRDPDNMLENPHLERTKPHGSDRRSGPSECVSGPLSAGGTVFTVERVEPALGIGRVGILVLNRGPGPRRGNGGRHARVAGLVRGPHRR